MTKQRFIKLLKYFVYCAWWNLLFTFAGVVVLKNFFGRLVGYTILYFGSQVGYSFLLFWPRQHEALTSFVLIFCAANTFILLNIDSIIYDFIVYKVIIDKEPLLVKTKKLAKFYWIYISVFWFKLRIVVINRMDIAVYSSPVWVYFLIKEPYESIRDKIDEHMRKKVNKFFKKG